jgi:hypothetical protein
MGAVKRDTLDVPRWALTLAIVLFLVVFLTMLLLFVMAQPAHASSLDTVNFDKPSKDWYQGPVRYIITKVEVKSYKALDTDAPPSSTGSGSGATRILPPRKTSSATASSSASSSRSGSSPSPRHPAGRPTWGRSTSWSAPRTRSIPTSRRSPAGAR